MSRMGIMPTPIETLIVIAVLLAVAPVFAAAPEQYGILTPPAPREPRISGPRVFGVRPMRPVLFTIPATGERPITFAAKNLPQGLALDSETGRITGMLASEGEHTVTLVATNARGKAERALKIVVGDR